MVHFRPKPIDLASHIRCHEDVRKYMCDVCGKRFRSQSHMTYHRYAHFEARNFGCDQCPQKFKSPHILRTHKNTVHSLVFKYECETCGRKFKRDHHLVVCSFIHLFYFCAIEIFVSLCQRFNKFAFFVSNLFVNICRLIVKYIISHQKSGLKLQKVNHRKRNQLILLK